MGISVDSLQDILDYRCSSSDQEMLVKKVFEEEIKSFLFSMPNNKSRGPDGYTSIFFKSTWPIIGNDFLIAVKAFFTKGFLPKRLNSTILVLIPKKEVAEEMKDYRPISCCNVLYKIISKFWLID